MGMDDYDRYNAGEGVTRDVSNYDNMPGFLRYRGNPNYKFKEGSGPRSNRRFTEEDYEKVHELKAKGLSSAEVGRLVGMSRSNVLVIMRKKNESETV